LIYVDTSILVPYYSPEPLSERVQQFLRETDEIALSVLGEVEFFSALARKVRVRELSRENARRISVVFSGHLEAGAYTRLDLDRSVYRTARGWIQGFNVALRTLDALHLAVAATSGLPIATADAALAGSARSLGLSVHHFGLRRQAQPKSGDPRRRSP
jgi:uncharacterized protein